MKDINAKVETIGTDSVSHASLSITDDTANAPRKLLKGTRMGVTANVCNRAWKRLIIDTITLDMEKASEANAILSAYVFL